MTIRHSTAMAIALTFLLVASAVAAKAAPRGPKGGDSPASPALIQPAELAKLLGSRGDKPLIIQVGFHTLYQQAHIPGSEYLGPASEQRGKKALRDRVQNLPREKAIVFVLYCGCCPWSHCPNVTPAYEQLRAMGFGNVKVLYIDQNFGADWVDKGYPVAKGE
jgi:thiosulfate/3-mercaptopyruvate sulfurtransferase